MLTIRLLGDLAVLRAGVPLTLPPSKKTRALLAYLVATRRVQRRERLCNLFWDVPDDPRGALRWSLSKLRALVDEPEGGPARIVADRETVAFVAEGASCDLHALRDLVGRGADTAWLDQVPTEQLLAVADGISGMFLEGLDLPSQPDFQAWCLAEREDLRRQHAALLAGLTSRLSPDAPTEALPHARQQVELDAFDADARIALVRLLIRLNRRKEAEQHCETGLRMLQEGGLPAGELSRVARELRISAAPARTEMPAHPDPAAELVVVPSGSRSTPQITPTGQSIIRRIVIVDDEPDIGLLVVSYLCRHGYAARAAASGAEMDALLAEEGADLIVLDVNLPNEDGFAIARRLRAVGGPLILFLTAADDIVDRVVGLELGAEDYIIKPFDLRELRARIGVALRRATQVAPVVETTLVPVAESASSAAFDAQQTSAAQPERKQVTVMVAVVEDGLDDGEGDAVDSRGRLDECLTVIQDAVRAQEGTIAIAGPNTVTAVFGAPVAQEDASVRACAAALAVQDALRNGRRVAGVAVHIGLHAGVAVIRPTRLNGEIEATGPVVRLTGRVAAATPADMIVVTPEITRRAEGFITTVPLGALGVGVAEESVKLFALTGRAPLRSRWDIRAEQGLTRFLGRAAELETLGRALSRAEVGSGQAVAIAGEPGIGKSRLMHEFLDGMVPPDWAVLTTAATSQEAGASYVTMGRLLRSWLDVGERESRDAIVAKLDDLIETRYGPLQAHRAALASLLDLPVDDPGWKALSPGLRRQAMQDALRAAFVLTSQRQPLILLLEDLHWADAPSLALFDALVEGLAAQRILILATHRPEYRPAWTGRSRTLQVRLDPLPATDAETVLQSLLGDDAGLTMLRRRLAARAEGVPLFLEEAVRSLAEAGVLSGVPGRYQFGQTTSGSVDLPPTVTAVLAARIDRLPSAAKSLLQTASVIGREFPLALLAHLTELDAEALQATLAELRAAEFLFESRLPPDTEYTFKHAMTQEAAYASVLREQRRNLHVELVRAIEALYEGRLAEQVDRLAEHALAGELWPEATHYLLRAAIRAIERSAHVQAADLLQRGLDAMQHLPDTQDRLRIELGYLKALGVTMMALRGWGAQEVSDAYTRARAICEQLDDQQELFVALRGQGQFHMIRGELHTAHELGRQCTAIAQARDNVGVRLETHHLFWSTSFFMGNVAEAEEHAARGMMMYRQDRDHRLTYMYSGHDPGVCCQCFSGLMLWQRGYPHKAVARCQSAFTLAEQIGHPLTLALAQWAMSYVHLFRNEAAEAALWAEREIALCQEYQLPLLLSQGAFQLGWALAEQGDPEAGIARMQEGLFGVTSTGAEMGLPYLIALLGEAQAKAGRPDVGLTEIERALAMARTNGGSFQAAEVFRLKGELLLLRHGRGMRSEAEACFREAAAIARGQGVRLPELRALAGLVRLKGKASGLDDERRELATACAALEEVQDLRDVQEAQALLRA